MNYYNNIYLLFFFSLLLFFQVSSKDFIILQSTTSARDSGLYDFILPKFDKNSGVEVRVIAVGTGQAIKNSRRCDADVLIAHHKESEEKLISKKRAETGNLSILILLANSLSSYFVFSK